MRLTSFVLVAVLAAACSKENPNFCDPSDPLCQIDASIDAPPVVACSTTGPDPECPDRAPVCASGRCTGCGEDSDCVGRPGMLACFGDTGMCVACNEVDSQAADVGGVGDDCQAAGMHVCDSATHTCRACEANSECTSGVCDGGSCITEGEIIYVATTGSDNPDCSSATPCSLLSLSIDEVNATRRFIVIAPGTYTDTTDADFNNKNATIIATGATLKRNGTGPVLNVRGTSIIRVLGGVVDAAGNGNDGISTASGTQLTLEGTTVKGAASHGIGGAGRLTIHDARIESNGSFGILSTFNGAFELTGSTLIRNGNGGLSLQAASAVIMNNNFVKNGAAGSLPALQITSLTSPNTSRIEFNTIAGNIADGTSLAAAASCSSTTIVLRNSILYFNNGLAQVVGCTVRWSTMQGAVPDAANGVINDAPSFVNTGMDNFHLMPGSVVAGKADPAADLTGPAAIDIDHQPRPAGGAAADLGSDEIP